MRVRWGAATLGDLGDAGGEAGGVGGEAAGAVLLGEAEDQGGGAAGLGDGVEGLADGGGGHVGEALLADPVARQRHRGADQPVAAGAEEAGLLEAVEPGAHGGAGGGGVEADGGDHADGDDVELSRHASSLLRRSARAGGADVGAALAAGAEHRLGRGADPGLGEVEDGAVDARGDAPDQGEAAVLGVEEEGVGVEADPRRRCRRPLKRVTGSAVAGRRKLSRPAGVRLTSCTSSPPLGRSICWSGGAIWK